MNAKSLHITVLVDAGEIPPQDPNFEEIGKAVTEYHVIQTLREMGHTVTICGFAEPLEEMIQFFKDAKPDLVFNLTEQFEGDRLFDKNIAGFLELLRLPYTGSGPLGLMLCRDKLLCKQLLSHHKIRVPAFFSFPLHKKIRIPKNIHYPLVVKPAFEDGSEGIAQASVVSGPQALLERIEFVHTRFAQPVVAEEYIEGREFYIGVLGNRRLTVLPPRECIFPSQQGPSLLTYRVKWNKQHRKKWNIEFTHADIQMDILKKISRICKKVYRILHLRDYGRIDLRLTPENRVVVLEVNPNPDVAYGEEVAEAAEKAGLDYEQFLDRIIRLALRRANP